MCIKRTKEEIKKLIDEANTIMDKEGTRFHAMSYEEGIVAALTWLIEDDSKVEYPLN
jgi:hypothetical protein